DRDGFCQRRAVIHPHSRQTLGPRRLEPAVGDACCHQHGLATDLGAVGKLYEPVRVLAPQPYRHRRGEDLCPEAACLGGGPATEVCTAEACWEAKVVLYPRALASLATGGMALDKDGT